MDRIMTQRGVIIKAYEDVVKPQPNEAKEVQEDQNVSATEADTTNASSESNETKTEQNQTGN